MRRRSEDCGKLQRNSGSGSELLLIQLSHSSTLTCPCGVSSLKNHGADEEVSGMFEMGAETMELPFEEKMKFEQGDNGLSAGLYVLCYLHCATS